MRKVNNGSHSTSDIVAQTARKRPWLAALLAFVHPGLGHVYLREWARALLWFGLVLTTASLLIPQSAVPETITLESIREMSRQLELQTVLAMAGVTLMSMIDAYWVASRNNERKHSRQQTTDDGATTSCPNCGREVDEDLDFCHWCTTELESDEAEPDGADEPTRA
jgi:hypothetical protein